MLTDIAFDNMIRTLMKRDEVLWDFAVSGAFLNELTQSFEPHTGRWWIQ
jgi:hypothetical protein